MFDKKQKVTYKNRIEKTKQMTWSRFSIKILGVHFVNSILDNNTWDKINEKLPKKSNLEQSATFFDRDKIIVNQILSSKL